MKSSVEKVVSLALSSTKAGIMFQDGNDPKKHVDAKTLDQLDTSAKSFLKDECKKRPVTPKSVLKY